GFVARGSRTTARALVAAPTYAAVFAGLLVATHSASFSISNLTAPFAFRMTTLCVLAGIAQLLVGGRVSVAPAAFVTSIALLRVPVVAALQPLAPPHVALPFMPLPPLPSPPL